MFFPPIMRQFLHNERAIPVCKRGTSWKADPIAILKSMLTAVALMIILWGRNACALPTCCQMPEKPITIEYFTLKEGHKEIIKDVNDPKFSECFLGYFIPEFGKTYTLASGEEREFILPEGWQLVNEGDKRYHQPPDGSPGVDIFGWIDQCCRVHLFDEQDEVYAWREGPIEVNNPGNKELRIGHGGGSSDIYVHIVAKPGLGERADNGTLLGTLDASQKHLHLAAQVYGEYKNPLEFMKKESKTCVIPEPHSALLVATGSFLVARKRRQQ